MGAFIRVLYRCLLSLEYDEAKQLLTVENVNSTDRFGNGVVAYICGTAKKNEVASVALLRYCRELGASPVLCHDTTPLHMACMHGCPLVVRELLAWRQLDIDAITINVLKFETPLDIALAKPKRIPHWEGKPIDEELLRTRTECAKLLLDAGASFAPNSVPRWVNAFVADKENCRAACITLLGLLRCGSPYLKYNGNVMPLIARCVWTMRGSQLDDKRYRKIYHSLKKMKK